MTWPTRYACAPGLDRSVDDYRIRPLGWGDRGPIRQWRNAQLAVLRQREPISETDQDRYYRDVLEPSFGQARPEQVLVGVECRGVLIGYGGVVHLDWADRRGEVSFLTDPARLDASTFAADWRSFLAMLVSMARDDLALHRLTTHAYASRTDLIGLLEEAGFAREGVLREHRNLAGDWTDVVLHGLLL